MSRVYFHTKNEGTAELLGRERAHMGGVCTDIATGLVPRLHGDDIDRYFTPQARGSLMSFKSEARDRWVGTMLRVGDEPTFHLNGEPLDNFSLVLNTVMAIGNDPLCLFARLHGQCELHAWVDGPDRAWLAGVIKQGLEIGLCREGMGWDGVVTLLEQSDVEPVVTSYSVCDSFPNAYAADWTPPGDEDDETRWDAWYDLPDEEQWDLAMTGLRSGTRIPPMTPDSLHGYFDHGKTLFDVLNSPRPADVTA